MGPAVFNGGFSTFLAFALLMMSQSYVFKSFFKIFFLVVLFGLFHGLVFLPVVLRYKKSYILRKKLWEKHPKYLQHLWPLLFSLRWWRAPEQTKHCETDGGKGGGKLRFFCEYLSAWIDDPTYRDQRLLGMKPKVMAIHENPFIKRNTSIFPKANFLKTTWRNCISHLNF